MCAIVFLVGSVNDAVTYYLLYISQCQKINWYTQYTEIKVSATCMCIVHAYRVFVNEGKGFITVDQIGIKNRDFETNMESLSKYLSTSLVNFY